MNYGKYVSVAMITLSLLACIAYAMPGTRGGRSIGALPLF